MLQTCSTVDLVDALAMVKRFDSLCSAGLFVTEPSQYNHAFAQCLQNTGYVRSRGAACDWTMEGIMPPTLFLDSQRRSACLASRGRDDALRSEHSL